MRLGREAIAEELKYELANTQAPNYTIFQLPRWDLIFFKRLRYVGFYKCFTYAYFYLSEHGSTIDSKLEIIIMNLSRVRVQLASLLGVLTIVISNLVGLPIANAAVDTCTWTGATSVNWSDGSNWTGCDNGGVPQGGDTLAFPAIAVNKSMTNNIAGLTPNQLIITGTGYTFNGNALTVSVSGNFIVASENATINLQVAFNGANTGGSVSTGKTLTFSQPVAFGSAFGQYWTGGGKVIFNGNITGTTGGMFRAENNTTVEVHGAANTFTSSFVGAESNGNYECYSATCFGDAANTIYAGGGKVKLRTSAVYTNPVATSSSTPDDSWLIAYEDITISGAVSINDPIAIAQYGTGSKNLQLNGPGFSTAVGSSVSFFGNNSTNSQIRMNSVLSGPAPISVANVRVQMTAANNYTGATTVNADGVILVENTSALGDVSGVTNVLDGGSLSFSGVSPLTVAENINVSGTGTSAYNGALYANRPVDTLLTGNIVLTGDTTVRNLRKGYTLALEGTISGTGNLTLVGVWDAFSGAYIEINGASPNTYVGTTKVNGGSVYFQKAGAIPGNLSIDNEGPGVNRSEAYFYNSSDVMADTGVLTMSADPDNGITFGANNEVIGGLQGANGVISIQTSGNKVIIDQNFNSTYDGTFYANGSLGTIEKRGTGSLTLTNTYQFINDEITFIVTEGTLVVNGDIRTTTGGNVQVNGGTLKGVGTVRDVTLNGGTIAPGNSPGILNVTSLTLNSSSIYQQQIAGATAGSQYDQLIATGAVTLGNATLNTLPTYTPADGTVFTIITAGSVLGTFNGLANGDTFTAAGMVFRINYTATTVTLTKLSGVVTVPNTGFASQSSILPYATGLAGLLGLLTLGLYAYTRRYAKR